jgi:hypothetical protein
MVDWSDEYKKLRKQMRKVRKQREAQGPPKKRIDWAAVFVVTPAAQVLLAVMAAAALACYFVYRPDNPDPPPATQPVHGKVIRPGRPPLPGGIVQFHHTTDTSLTVVGQLQPDGTFRLVTIKGKGRADGAPVGEYKVSIVPAGKDPAAGKPIHLPRTVKVVEGKNELTLEATEKR